jgi:sRNA-binding protein
MKYYSEITKQLYDKEEDLVKAETTLKLIQAKKEAEAKAALAKKEAEEKAKKAERAKRAKEVEEALKAATEASAKATNLLKKFSQDYGYFHMSYTTDPTKEETNNKVNGNTDFFDLLFNFLK